MSKKGELALQYFEAVLKCDCEAAERVLADPGYDVSARVMLDKVHDPAAREALLAKTFGHIQAEFAAACPRAADTQRALARLAVERLVDEGLEQYSEAIDQLSRE